MKMVWIIGKFTVLTIVILEIMKYVLADYMIYFKNIEPIFPLFAFMFAWFVNMTADSQGGFVMKKKMSKKVKVALIVLVTFFLSKRLRDRLYTIISEVKTLFATKVS